MAARDRDDIGTGAMEIAFDVSPFAIAGFRNSQPLQTAMIGMSMLAMVICLFGGYVDSPDEHSVSTAARETQDESQKPQVVDCSSTKHRA